MTKFIIFSFLILLSACTQKQSYVSFNGQKLRIETATTDAQKTQGLSGRTSLCSDCGMMFLFKDPGVYGFWMKDMKFSLDFIYLNNDEVVWLIENVSPQTYPEVIMPKRTFDKVIEVNSGTVSRLNIKIGQKSILDL